MSDAIKAMVAHTHKGKGVDDYLVGRAHKLVPVKKPFRKSKNHYKRAR